MCIVEVQGTVGRRVRSTYFEMSGYSNVGLYQYVL